MRPRRHSAALPAPHSRFGSPEEVAKLARFLLSADSSFIVGENITIDGGVRLT